MLQRQQISTAPILMVGTFLFRISMVIVMITTTTIMKSVVASNNNIHHRILASAGTISSSRKRCSTTTTPIAFGSRKNNQQRHLQYNQGTLQQQQQLSDWLRDGRSIGRGANIWTNSRLYEQISSPSASPITTTKDERRMQKQQRRIARKAEHLSQITDDKKEVTTSLANDEQQRNEDDDTTTTSATGLEFEKKFDFSSNPRWDVRFQNDIHTHENFQYDSSNVQEYQKIHEKEATEDTNAARQLKQYHQAYKSLDQAIVQRAMDALRPYVQTERIERIESILRQRTQHTRFLFENPVNPSNVFACLRTLDAFGIQNVDIILDKSTYKGKAAVSQKRGLRTAVGSAQWLTINYHLTTNDAIAAIREQSNGSVMIYASDLNPSSQDIRTIQWDRYRADVDQEQQNDTSEQHCEPTICIVMGNEDRGISDEMKQLVDCTFTLPMVGFAESYNLSVATAITLAHLSAQSSVTIDGRAIGPLRPGDLPPDQYQCLLLKGIMNSVAQKRIIPPLLKRENIILPPEIMNAI